MGECKELVLEAAIENIPSLTAEVDGMLEAMDCPMRTQVQIDIAIDELFSNIANCAYGDSTGQVTVRIETACDPNAITITFIDCGRPYNPLTAEEPDITLSAAERKIGGLGIFMVKKSMDDIRYESRDGKNILTIYKKF